jgi:hypothetical protein
LVRNDNIPCSKIGVPRGTRYDEIANAISSINDVSRETMNLGKKLHHKELVHIRVSDLHGMELCTVYRESESEIMVV